ncbi:MAG: cation:proton antiporter [Bacteroidetes bacterium]|nr:cation:proton antiporter [Bacteroidota bacterium]
MLLLNSLDFSLPLTNPVIIFSIVLFIILFAPIVLNKVKVPHIIGLIVAGIVIGPHGLNLLTRDSSIVLFGTVGLLYIMFLAGLEIDLAEFKKNSKKIIVFGLATFTLPFVFGTLLSHYFLGFSFLSSMLLASMFSTHTLVSYPIVGKYGVVRNMAVTLTVGGTMITDIFALIILAVIAGLTKEESSSVFWIQLGVSCIAFVGIIFFLFPPLIQWFFKKFEDSVSQYVFVLATVFLSAFLAEAAGLEAIIGAFFSGLVLNKFVPHQSALMNRINFVGNAIFIPFFLIGVGMLVDVQVITKGWNALKVASLIISVAIATKFLAAWLTQKLFGMSINQRNIIFGLSTSHAAATLAIILVGYNIIIGETATGEPIRLLNEDVLNGTILLILVSCAVGSFVVEKAASKIAMEDESASNEPKEQESDRILVSLNSSETVVSLLDLALMMKSPDAEIFTLQVVDDSVENANGGSKSLLDKAVTHSAATEQKIIPLNRYDANMSNGIIYTIKEQNVSDTIIGLPIGKSKLDFLENDTQSVLKRNSGAVYIYNSANPINTLTHMVVVVPANAHLEPGFVHWNMVLSRLAKANSMRIAFYGSKNILNRIKDWNNQSAVPVEASFNAFERGEDFLIFSKLLKRKDLLVVISSRKNGSSYSTELSKMPYFLSKYFDDYNFLLLFPEQLDSGINMENIEQVDGKLIETISEKIEALGDAGRAIKRIFKQEKKKPS